MDLAEFEVFQEKLLKITDQIENRMLTEEDGALHSFEVYLDTIIQRELFSVSKWPIRWRRSFRSFFRVFVNDHSAAKLFLRVINKKLEITDNVDHREPCYFLKLGILYYINDDEKYQKVTDLAKNLVKQYPQNSEFLIFCAKCLSRRGDTAKALSFMKNAMRMEGYPDDFLSDILDVETKYFEELIQDENFDAAETFLSQMQEYYESHFFGAEWEFIRRQLILFKSRLSDHRQVSKELYKVNEIILLRAERERRRLVEVWGVFGAILTFIIVNMQIAISFTFQEAFWLMMTMGSFLLIFAVVISILFSSKDSKMPFYLNSRFWIMAVLAFMLSVVGMRMHPSMPEKQKTYAVEVSETEDTIPEMEESEREEAAAIEESNDERPSFRKLYLPDDSN